MANYPDVGQNIYASEAVVWLLTALLECLDWFKCNGTCHNLCWLSAYNRYCLSLIWSNVTVISITAITQSTTWSGGDKWPCDAIDLAVPIDSNWCREVQVVSDCVKPLTLLVEWMRWVVRCYQRSWLPGCNALDVAVCLDCMECSGCSQCCQLSDCAMQLT